LPARPALLLITEPPPAPDAPASGLSVRHRFMAEALSARGLRVTRAWPETPGLPSSETDDDADETVVVLRSASDVADWLARHERSVVILGYWGLAGWLPDSLRQPLVLDQVAPRLLEGQFEDRSALAADAGKLLSLLARCDEVWVGNEPQRHLMLAWMLMAGHDCRYREPVCEVPIAGRPVEARPPAGESSGPLRIFHGGRDWPWRDASGWLAALRTDSPFWRLDDGGECSGLRGHADYLDRLERADLALELADDNVERRYSQSFRMTDALCRGVPVICNRFLPLARTVDARAAGWLVDRPAALPELLESIHADRAELARRAANAAALARDRLDAESVYGGLAERLESLSDQTHRPERRPLAGRAAEAAGPGWPKALGAYARRWFDHRFRRPLHRWLRRLARNRPRPSDAAGRCWIVVSRPDLFPTDHGAAVKIERTAWALSFHVDEVLLITDRRGIYWRYAGGERETRRFPIWLRAIGWPRAVNLIRLMARGWPYSNAFLYLPVVDRGINARLLWLLRRHPVEAVQGEFPAYALPAVWAKRLFGTRAVLVEHNVEFDRIGEQVPELSAPGRQRLRRLELDVAGACDRVITVSERDRRRLIDSGLRPGLVETIPHGVDLDRFRAAEALDLRARYGIPGDHAVLVYHGIYSYPPNREAVAELSGALLPALAARGITAGVVAIGPEPPAVDLPGVTFTGAVDDLAGHLAGADLAVVPLRAGGGTRMKLLDDFAAGVAVVTTTKGMEGIEVRDGIHLRVADDAEAMVGIVAELLADQAARRRLADAARAWVAAFDWREIARRYVESVRAAG